MYVIEVEADLDPVEMSVQSSIGVLAIKQRSKLLEPLRICRPFAFVQRSLP